MGLLQKLFSCISCLFFGACSINERSQTDPIDKLLNPLNSNTLIIVNGLSEDFTVVNNINSKPNITRHVPMGSQETASKHPCESPNFLEKHGNHLFVTCSLSHEIQIFSMADLSLKRIIALETNSNPWSTVISEGIGYVSSFLKDKIISFDPRPNQLSTRILGEFQLQPLPLETDKNVSTRAFPEGMVKVGDHLFVAIPNLTQTVIGSLVSGGPGYVAVINTTSPEPVALIKASGRNTVSVYHSGAPPLANFIFAVNAGSYDENNGGYVGDGSIDQIDLKTKTIVRSIQLAGAPFEMTISQNGIAYVTNGREGKILRFNTLTGASMEPIDLRKNSCNNYKHLKLTYISSLLIENNRLFATDFNSNCLFIIDTQNNEIIFQLKTGDGPEAMVLR